MEGLDTAADQRRRQRLVRDALADCADERVRNAMARLPRHCFCLPGSRAAAYDDHAMPIGFEQTISQPSLIAAMLSFLSIKPGMTVLDIGSGSGYVSALIALLLEDEGRVLALERISGLQAQAKESCAECLEEVAHERITWQLADASLGAPEKGPFDAIHVACVFPELPDELIEQLKPGGKLIIPVGHDRHQELFGITKSENSEFEKEKLMNVLFVPLRSGTA